MNLAIISFLADTDRDSLELPHMTTGQRKQTKKILDQYPDITCESCGFGTERRLHLFKKTHVGEPMFPPADVGDEEKASTPTKSTTTRSPALSVSTSASFSEPATSFVSRTGENVSSSAASSDDEQLTCLLECLGESPPPPPPATTVNSNLMYLGQVSEGFSVRNTFIHVEEESGAHTADDRAVRSMPRGMFGLALKAETLEANAIAAAEAAAVHQALLAKQAIASHASAPSAPPVGVAPILAPPPLLPPAPLTSCALGDSAAAIANAPSPVNFLTPGTEVHIVGLEKCPAFNGLTGTVLSHDEATGRYNVLLAPLSSEGKHQWAKIKGENLVLSKLNAMLPPTPSGLYYPQQPGFGMPPPCLPSYMPNQGVVVPPPMTFTGGCGQSPTMLQATQTLSLTALV